ncbi:hypothetical protein Sjap_010447 [Stephania japonica]|uniref:Uncharacterized protein n=1 Tax=Stephania japonica TaxID=461633 RepID=A0AAP0JB80_9MAGN
MEAVGAKKKPPSPRMGALLSDDVPGQIGKGQQLYRVIKAVHGERAISAITYIPDEEQRKSTVRRRVATR